MTVHEHETILPEQIRRTCIPGHDFILNDHTFLPTEAMAQVQGLRHVIFLGTGARSYMDVEGIERLGISVHTIRGYGDTAVGEHAIALMWAAARNIACSTAACAPAAGRAAMRSSSPAGRLAFLVSAALPLRWPASRSAAECGSLPGTDPARSYPGVEFVDVPTLLAESDVLSLHLLLTDETRHIIDASHIAAMKPGVILVNTARAGLIDTAAVVAALRDGRIRHAAIDVFDTEPLPAGDVLTTLPNVTLTSHDGFNTPEASENLIRIGLDIAKRLAQG